MSAQTETTAHVARKDHRCTWCWQRIKSGGTYQRYRFFDGGDVGTVKMHPECYGAMQELAAEEGGVIEWVPGMERPAAKTASHDTGESNG